MDENDIVDLRSIARARSITTNQARRVVTAAFLTGVAGGILAAAVAYWAYDRLATASVMFGVFTLLGAWQAIHWTRHYRNIMRQLDGLERRVAHGETIYGPQVKFHSYR